jgi:hypothetical protein
MQGFFHSRADFVCRQDVRGLRTLFWMRPGHHVLPVDKRQSSSGCIGFGCDVGMTFFL